MRELEKLQDKVYNEQLNYRIDFSDRVRKDVVAVYITSNALFFPHTAEGFQKAILEKDRYEWTRMKIRRAQKHIFIRDVYKQWYATGINSQINSIDKLIDWLRNEVNGYKYLIVSGSSGGGYAAALVGARLKASLIIDFNGQWEINSSIEKDGKVVSPILKKMKDESDEGIKYFNIACEEFDYERTFYLVSDRSPWDCKQLRLVEDFKNIHIIRFRNKHHGIPFMKVALPRILNMTYEELCVLEKDIHRPVLFEMKLVGVVPTVKYLFHLAKKILKKRFQR